MEPLKGYIFSTGTSGYHGLGEEPPDGCGSFVQSNVSFKDKMIENKERAPSHTRRDLLRENLTKIEFENGNSLKKMVHIDDSVFDVDENIMEQTDEMELVSRAIPTNEIDPGPTKGTWR
ncbi:hypothetical protein JHK84_033647 [Glycine max]|nr:hypothetical protein JHK84_033647 [Glycine max]